MVFEAVMVVVGLVFLLTASYSDIRTREVPDWISYGLMFVGLGLRLMFSFVEGWELFASGLLGLGVGWLLAYMLYVADQWGGGDSKLLMGVGSLVGLWWGSYQFGWFLLGLIFLGAFWGLLWSIGVAITGWKGFTKSFKKLLKEHKWWHLGVWIFSGVIGVLSIWWVPLLTIVGFILGSFYLICFIVAIEKSGFTRKIAPEHLVEGDWLEKNVEIKNRIVMHKRALEKRDIRRLMVLKADDKLNYVLIKEGAPFVPGFLFSFVVVFLAKNWTMGIIEKIFWFLG